MFTARLSLQFSLDSATIASFLIFSPDSAAAFRHISQASNSFICPIIQTFGDVENYLSSPILELLTLFLFQSSYMKNCCILWNKMPKDSVYNTPQFTDFLQILPLLLHSLDFLQILLLLHSTISVKPLTVLSA